MTTTMARPPVGLSIRPGVRPPQAGNLHATDRSSKALLTWRGQGGASATPGTVEFDKQLDKISMWLEHWTHETRCMILEKLIRESSFVQLRLLWTVMQPALHRDFMYTAAKQFPTEQFTPISTYTSRDVISRLHKEDKLDFHRLNSAHIHMSVSRDGRDVTLPAICASSTPNTASSYVSDRIAMTANSKTHNGRSTQHSNYTSCPSRMSRTSYATKASTFSKSSTISKSTRVSVAKSNWSRASSDGDSGIVSGTHSASLIPTPQAAPSPCIRFIEMPVRRHMQEDGTPRRITSSGAIDNAPTTYLIDEPPVGAATGAADSTSAFAAVPDLGSRWQDGWKTPLPVAVLPPGRPTAAAPPPVHSQSDPKTHDLLTTPRPKAKSKIRLKVKVNPPEDQGVLSKSRSQSINRLDKQRSSVDIRQGQHTNTSTSIITKTKDSTSAQENPLTRMNTSDVPKEVMRASASLDIPSEGWQLLHWYTTTWNALQRNEFLHKLLIKLDPRQHYYLSSLLSVKHHVDIIGLLPEVLALRILSYLRPRDLLVSLRVSKKWFKLCNNNMLWRKKCRETTIDIPVTSPNPNWKTVFKDNKSINSNWNTGNCTIVECKGHHEKVLTVVFDGIKMATGSADKSIKIWDVRDGRCLQTLKGHEKGVWALRFFTDTLLISASYDTTIRVWNMKEGTVVRTLIAHSGPVWAIERAGNVMVSASEDGTAKVWDISRCQLQMSLRGHNGPVFCVDLDEDGKVAVTGSSDRTVRLWSTESGRQLRLIWVPGCIMAVSYSRKWIAASHGNSVSLYQSNGKLLSTFDGHQKRVECLELKIKDSEKPTGTIISAGKDGIMKQWDIAKGECTKSFVVSKGQVNCVRFDEMRIASAAYDHKVKIWDFTVPEKTTKSNRR